MTKWMDGGAGMTKWMDGGAGMARWMDHGYPDDPIYMSNSQDIVPRSRGTGRARVLQEA